MSAPDDHREATSEPAEDSPGPPPTAVLVGAEAARADVAAAATAALETEAATVAPPEPSTCPLLRLAGPDGAFGPPGDVPAAAHRCTATGEPIALSDRQQALVCLTAAHLDCPRFHRASARAMPVTEGVVVARRRPHPATVVATALLAVSAFLAIAFVAANGGIAMPALSPTPGATASAVAAASPSPASPIPSATPTPGATPTPSPSATPTPSPSATPTPSPSATPTPSPSATPTAAPTPTATPRPSSDRYDLLEPCPGKVDCYIYTVRAGDNVVSIANYFGVPLATVYDLNPWLRTRGLRAGQKLILPPPTR